MEEQSYVAPGHQLERSLPRRENPGEKEKPNPQKGSLTSLEENEEVPPVQKEKKEEEGLTVTLSSSVPPVSTVITSSSTFAISANCAATSAAVN